MSPLLKRLLLVPLAVSAGGALAALLFLTAGRWDIRHFWAYASLYTFMMVVGFLAIGPELIRERVRSGMNQRIPLAIAAKLAMATHLVLAGLDVGRFHWSDTVPFELHIVGLVGFAAGFGFVMWSMAVNPFFLPVVAVQPERGHHVITAGPYGWVRHPGYTGIIVGVLCSTLALGSWLSGVPMLILIGGIMVRVTNEDRFLAEHLEGYVEYSQRVRYRLLPMVW